MRRSIQSGLAVAGLLAIVNLSVVGCSGPWTSSGKSHSTSAKKIHESASKDPFPSAKQAGLVDGGHDTSSDKSDSTADES